MHFPDQFKITKLFGSVLPRLLYIICACSCCFCYYCYCGYLCSYCSVATCVLHAFSCLLLLVVADHHWRRAATLEQHNLMGNARIRNTARLCVWCACVKSLYCTKHIFDLPTVQIYVWVCACTRICTCLFAYCAALLWARLKLIMYYSLFVCTQFIYVQYLYIYICLFIVRINSIRPAPN